MAESELAAMMGMSQYAHTQPNETEAALGGGVAGGRKRRRAAGGAEQGGAAGYTLAALLELCPCSEAELREALGRCNALRDGDRYFSVPPDLHRAVLAAVLRSAAAQGGLWPLRSVPAAAVVADLEPEGFSEVLVHHALRSLAAAAEGAAPAAIEPGALRLDTYCLDFARVARFVGSEVLLAAGAAVSLQSPAAASGRAVPLAAFMSAWAAAMPVGTVVSHLSSTAEAPPGAAGTAITPRACSGQLSLELLSGEVLLTEGAAGAGVLLLPARELAAVPALRFKQLFALRARWRLPDLEPFIAPVATAGASQTDLLLAHTRTTLLPDGTRLFSAR
jgi:hypothetical protein